MMATCQADGCYFFAPEGRRYCSSHFKVLASEEEKANAEAEANKRNLEIKQAEDAWEAAVTGPISEANEALKAVLVMPGYKESFPLAEIEKVLKTRDLSRVLRMSECQDIKFGERSTLPAVLFRLLSRNHTFDEPIFDEILQHPTVNADTLDFEIMQSEIYSTWRDIRLLEKILRRGRITQKLIKSAEYSVKRPHNSPSPRQNEIIKLVKNMFKEQQKSEGKVEANYDEKGEEESSKIMKRSAEEDEAEDIDEKVKDEDIEPNESKQSRKKRRVGGRRH